MSKAAIELSEVKFTSSNLFSLNIDQFHLGYGEVLGITGPNGAGKTTFVKICLGLARVDKGKVLVLGHDLINATPAQKTILRRKIGYVPQILPSKPEAPLTVREVLAIGRTAVKGLFKKLDKVDREICDLWLEKLGIQHLANRNFSTLSGGEQRKVCIARAMVKIPELLLFDEPCANLDLGWREKVVDSIQMVCESTKLTAIIVAHEPDSFPVCCRRIVLFESGRITKDSVPEKVLTSETISRIYGIDLLMLHENGRHWTAPKSNQ